MDSVNSLDTHRPSPLDLWQNRLNQGQIVFNLNQLKAIESLSLLWERLEKDVELGQKGQAFGNRLWGNRLWGKITNRLSKSPPKLSQHGIYIHGEVGRGKSMLMDLFYQALSTPKKRRCHFHEFMLEIHHQLNLVRLNPSSDKGDPLPLIAKNYAKKIKIICFDEFHIQDIADAMIMTRLFHSLFMEGVIMVATSNQAPDLLYPNGLQRQHILPFIEILKQGMEIIHLTADEDYRMRSLPIGQGEGLENQHLQKYKGSREFNEQIIYAKPQQADEQILELIKLYYLQPKSQALTLNHLHRQITFATAFLAQGGQETHIPNILWSNFDELCIRNLSAIDYLALSERLDILIITKIPILGEDDKNAIKRLMILIDILYEKHKGLIVNLPIDLDRLCQNRILAKEFARTQSRIYEMIHKG